MSAVQLAPKACPGCAKRIRKGCEICAPGQFNSADGKPRPGDTPGQVPACVECGGSGLKASAIAGLGVVPCPECQATGYGNTDAVRLVLARRQREKKRTEKAPPQQQAQKGRAAKVGDLCKQHSFRPSISRCKWAREFMEKRNG